MKIRGEIRTAVEGALCKLGLDGEGIPVVLERPREAAHGDMSTPVAMALAKKLRRNPNEIADEIVSSLSLPEQSVASVAVLKPGFINFRFADAALRANVPVVIRDGDRYGSSGTGGGKRALVEYVSANPTGPLVVVSARAAAVGAAIVNLLKFVGFEAEGEYYVNDYGRQVEALGASFLFRLRERFGLLDPGEEIGSYPGDYLTEIALGVPEDDARRMMESEVENASRYAIDAILGGIDDDLDAFGVFFDNRFLESTLHDGAVADTLDSIVASGSTYEEDGAVYFRSTDMGDDKDRVLVKGDGNPTYFLADVAYHKNKYDRGFEKAIDLLGPDHHGHVPRMKAAMSVIGAARDWL